MGRTREHELKLLDLRSKFVSLGDGSKPIKRAKYISDWWFGTCFIFPYIGFHIFQRGRYTTLLTFINHYITIINHH